MIRNNVYVIQKIKFGGSKTLRSLLHRSILKDINSVNGRPGPPEFSISNFQTQSSLLGPPNSVPAGSIPSFPFSQSLIQDTMASAARNVAARSIHIKIHPTARSLPERREVLRVLERFGEIEMFRSLKVRSVQPHCHLHPSLHKPYP